MSEGEEGEEESGNLERPGTRKEAAQEVAELNL